MKGLPLAVTTGLLLFATPSLPREDQRLPSGKSQKDAIIQAEHEKSLRDVQEILRVAEELKEELQKTEGHVLSVGAIKKTEEIEKLARDVRSRMKRTW